MVKENKNEDINKKNKSFTSGKLGIAALCFVTAIVMTFIFGIIQNKVSYPNGVRKVVYAVRSISANTNITKQNVDYYFTTESSDTTLIIDGAVSNKNDLIGKYITSDILKGEQISSKNVEQAANRLKDIKNLEEFSITFSDISSCVNGTLRAGDVINLILTTTNQNTVVTKSVLRNVVIAQAFTSDGQVVSRENSNLAASKLNLYGSPEDQAQLDNALAQGKVHAVKALGNSISSDITIESTIR